MQLEKTSYTLASPLVVGRISAGNNLYIKSDQLVNDKSIIESRNDSYLHSKNITAISQKLGEKSVWVAMHNALDQSANYIYCKDLYIKYSVIYQLIMLIKKVIMKMLAFVILSIMVNICHLYRQT